MITPKMPVNSLVLLSTLFAVPALTEAPKAHRAECSNTHPTSQQGGTRRCLSASHLPQAKLSSASSPPGILLGLSCILSAELHLCLQTPFGSSWVWHSYDRVQQSHQAVLQNAPWGVSPKPPQEVPRLAPWTVFLVCFGIFCFHDHQSNDTDCWVFSSSKIIIIWNEME